MAVTTDQLLDKLNQCVSELQKAELTIVEAMESLANHDKDPQAHQNLSNSGLELTVTSLSEEVLVLKDAIKELEDKDREILQRIANLEHTVNTNS